MKPDVIITDNPNYAKDKPRIVSWHQFAAELLPKLQAAFPAFRNTTLEEFIRDCPYNFEIVDQIEDDD